MEGDMECQEPLEPSHLERLRGSLLSWAEACAALGLLLLFASDKEEPFGAEREQIWVRCWMKLAVRVVRLLGAGAGSRDGAWEL